MDSTKDIKDINYNNSNKKREEKNDNKKEQKKEKKDIREVLSKIDVSSVIGFVKKYARYFSAGALFILLLVVLVFFTEVKEDGKDAESTETEVEAFQENAYPEVNQLIENYYAAYAAGDIDTLRSIAAPISEREQGYISLFSQFVESYQNMVFYTKTGLDANSYMVNVYYEAKFTGVDTLAPGLDFFYVRTNEDGTLYIDNLYSQYNMRHNESPLDVSVQNMITEYENEADVIALLQEIQQKYEEVVASDENLANMLNVTIPQAISEWVATLVDDSNTVAEGTETAENTETVENTEITEGTDITEGQENTAAEEGQGNEQPEEQPEETKETVKALSKVNVRAAADTASERLGSVDAGTVLTRTGTDGEWSMVEYNGGIGYIKSEYLTTDTAAEISAETPAADGLTEGTEVTLQSTTNIRSSMSETADKVGVAYPGEKVTVVMSYAEGWTKVTWNGKTGYIKTELLK